MYHKWKHKVTTDRFCNFLRNLHWALKMTTDWFWNFLGNQHLSQMRTQSHYIVFSVFLETSTKPPTQSTVWFIFFYKTWIKIFQFFFETKVTTDWFCNFLGNQHWTPKMTTDWFRNFLGNQHLALWAHQITTNSFFSFLGNQHQATDKVYSLVYNFLGQNWMGTFLKPSHYRLVYKLLWLYSMVAPNPFKKVFLGVNPYHFVEEIPMGICF